MVPRSNPKTSKKWGCQTEAPCAIESALTRTNRTVLARALTANTYSPVFFILVRNDFKGLVVVFICSSDPGIWDFQKLFLIKESRNNCFSILIRTREPRNNLFDSLLLISETSTRNIFLIFCFGIVNQEKPYVADFFKKGSKTQHFRSADSKQWIEKQSILICSSNRRIKKQRL